MIFLKILEKNQKNKLKKSTFKVYLAFNLYFLKIKKINEFDDY